MGGGELDYVVGQIVDVTVPQIMDEILGIRMQLKDEMSVDLAHGQKAEADRKANHAALVAAKEEEVASLTVTTVLRWKA